MKRMHPLRSIGMLTLLALVAGTTTPPALAGKTLLRLRLDGPVREAPSQQFDLLAAFSGTEAKTLLDWVDLIRDAGARSDVSGIVLIIEQPQLSLAQAEELTRALKDFRAKGKTVHCYLDSAGNLSYALACAADHITLSETSELSIAGLNAELSFYRGLLDKIGVQAQMLHCGAYKAALEPFTRTEPSPEYAANINWLLDGLYQRWLQLMADGRGLSVQEIEAAVNTAPISADQALERKLVDEVSSFTAFKQRLHKEFGQDVKVVKKLKAPDDESVGLDNPMTALIEIWNKVVEGAREATAPKPGIAVLYIEGGIVVGKNEPSLLSGSTAGSTTIRAAFEKARADEKVKAVVVRVNSPGGSALGSDIMWQAATRCAAEKPLVVSMGAVAGSGGYYVSIPGDVIFAEESTITASIGVVGGKLVWNDLMEDKLGITTTEFRRGEHAGLMSFNTPWSEAERQVMQDYMERIYVQFKQRIVSSRGERIKGELEEHAAGRVFTGKQALERGLVDRLGGLRDAIAYAAEKAGLGSDPEIYTYPEEKNLGQILAQLMGEETEDEWEVRTSWQLGTEPALAPVLPLLHALSPQQSQRILADLRNLLILSREHVGCFMPAGLQPR